MSTLKSCPGKFCKGKKLPLTRFEKHRNTNDGRRGTCKMCFANKNDPEFVLGKCAGCKEDHDCSFGTGKYCSRSCATGRTVKIRSTADGKITHKVCTKNTCIHGGKEQPIKNFYKRNDGVNTHWRSQCKDCALQDIRKHQTTFDGYVKGLLNSAKRRSRQYTRGFTITIEDLKNQYKKQNGKCAISGTKLTHVQNDNGTSSYPSNMSLDRIDSSKGYTPDNIQLVCAWVNTAKSDYDQERFIKWIVQAANHIQGKRGQILLDGEWYDNDLTE